MSLDLIDEIWIAKDGICLFHRSWVEESKKVQINMQLFSAFSTAISTFSKSSFPSEGKIRNIDFMNTRFFFDYIHLGIHKLLIVFKFSNENIFDAEKQQNFINRFLAEFKGYILEFNLKEAISLQTSMKNTKPLSQFNFHFNSFIDNFLFEYQNTAEKMERIYILGIINYIKELNNVFSDIVLKQSLCEENGNQILSMNLAMNKLTPIVYDLLYTLELGPLEIDNLPEFSFEEIKYFVRDLVNYFSNLLPISDYIPDSFRRAIFKSYTKNFEAIKFFELDDLMAKDLLPIFY